jgi:DNA mismatch repair protein MutL
VIRKLPPEVVNQIAAGEVVERPASVVKELVENALDAGARRVRVELRAGGAEAIVVVDDGDGFLPEDLPLAFASHATSKLSAVDDLDHIASLGFRGEALASIGAVARCRIQSRRHDAREGWEIRCEGGAETPAQPCGAPAGTRMEVRDLFFNVPARRRFLKSAAAERARIQELLAELSLARLDVDFTLVADDREILRLPRDESLAQRFARCFGDDLAGGLLPVARRFDGLEVEGVIAEPDLARRDGKLELLFVNGRRARESSSLHAVRQAYREYLMGGRFPVYALHVALPPDQVDVNIHPRKAEVRFVDARMVAGRLHETVRAALLGRAGAPIAGGIAVAPDLPRARSGFPQLPAGLFGEPLPPSPAAPTAPRADDFVVRETPGSAPASAASPAGAAGAAGGAPAARPAVVRPNPFRRVSGRFLQVMDLYLLLEADDGLLVVDQHALHERVMYESLRRQHAARAVQCQRLLTPTVVEVTPAELAWFESAQDDLAREGLHVAPFGPGAVAVHAVPTVLARIDAAILEHPHNCPHGRPTVLTFTPAELERYFRRRC